jgi:DnaJ-class molecular chaperone
VFKKIGNAFKILSDKEKRQFYDKYGTEEEFREKYQQQYHHQEDEEIDPFVIIH